MATPAAASSIPCLRTQSHPHTDLMRLLDDEVGNHALDADQCQNQSENAKCSDECRLESRFCNGIGDDLIQGMNIRDARILVHRSNHACHRRGQRHRIRGCLSDDITTVIVQREWRVIRRGCGYFHNAVPDVVHHADDFHPRLPIFALVIAEAFAHRIPRYAFAREFLADDGHARRIQILRFKIAAFKKADWGYPLDSGSRRWLLHIRMVREHDPEARWTRNQLQNASRVLPCGGPFLGRSDADWKPEPESRGYPHFEKHQNSSD